MSRMVESPSSRKTAYVLAAIAGVVCLVPCLWLVNSQRAQPEVHPAPAREPDVVPRSAELPRTSDDLTLPVIRASRFANTHPSATYVDSAACVDCHQNQHQTYLKTAHSRSLTDATPSLAEAEFDDPVSGRSYRVYQAENQLRHQETFASGENEKLELADHAMRFMVGSGAHAHTFLIETSDGFLAESPLTWYAKHQSWALSPGFSNYNTGFARAVHADCLFCHAGRVEALGGNRSRVAVHAMAIDCQRCHGPGSLHVALHEAEPEVVADIDLTIVNPAHLSRDQNEAICAQCHLDSIADVAVRGRSIYDFRPGQATADFRVHFALRKTNTDMKVVGHVEQLRLSKCYQRSEMLTCTTCHASHGDAVANTSWEFYREKCLACHSQQPCKLPDTTRLRKSPQDNCLACHMPTSATDVPHVAATHHRIGVHTGSDASVKPPEVGELIPLDDIAHLPQIEQDRCLALAYLDVSLGERVPSLSSAYRVRARDLLEDVKQRGLNDPRVDAALAKVYQRENPSKAIVFAEFALQSPDVKADTRTQALFSLSNAYLSLKQVSLAIEPLEQLVQLRRQAGDWFLLGVCRLQTGDIEGALKAATRAAEIRPDKPNFQELLAELYRHAGQTELADQHQQRAKLLATPRPPPPPTSD